VFAHLFRREGEAAVLDDLDAGSPPPELLLAVGHDGVAAAVAQFGLSTRRDCCHFD